MFFLVPKSIFSHPNNKHLMSGFMQRILWTMHCSMDFTNNNFLILTVTQCWSLIFTHFTVTEIKAQGC